MSDTLSQTTPATRPLRPPRQHDWADYMDGDCRCSACGLRRRTWEMGSRRPCVGAAKVTVDVHA